MRRVELFALVGIVSSLGCNSSSGPASGSDARAGGYLVWHVRSATTDGYTLPFCTGTLLAPDVVITAAHCVDDLDAHKAEAAAQSRTPR